MIKSITNERITSIESGIIDERSLNRWQGDRGPLLELLGLNPNNSCCATRQRVSLAFSTSPGTGTKSLILRYATTFAATSGQIELFTHLHASYSFGAEASTNPEASHASALRDSELVLPPPEILGHGRGSLCENLTPHTLDGVNEGGALEHEEVLSVIELRSPSTFPRCA